MSFTVLVPARLASTRLPGKPLADIGGLPMVARVAQRAALSAARRVVVAAVHVDIVDACERHGVEALLTRADHATGSDRLAEACALLGLEGTDVVVNVQGDEPLIEPGLIDACAHLLGRHPDCVMSTAAHAIDSSLCPLCCQSNQCANEAERATGVPQGPCWCTKAVFAPELLARVPEEARRLACICARCAAAADAHSTNPSTR